MIIDLEIISASSKVEEYVSRSDQKLLNQKINQKHEV
jgi:hypothetical protein